jgi:hypothetical protein
MIGQGRVKNLLPANCNGQWGQAIDTIFGFTVYTMDGLPFDLQLVTVVIQHADDSFTNETVWTKGVGFDAKWVGASSTWVTPDMTMKRVANFVTGDTVRFTVKINDNAVQTSYCSWICGVLDPPGSGVAPDVGAFVHTPVPAVRTMGDGGNRICEITEVTGLPGSEVFTCVPCDRTQCGNYKLDASKVTVVGPRDYLDSSITVTG